METITQIAPYPKNIKIKKIAFLGGASWNEEDQTYIDAYNMAKVLAENGYEVMNGGGPGVMRAATLGSAAGNGKNLIVTYHPNKPKKNYEGVDPLNTAQEEVFALDYFDRTKIMLINSDLHIVFNGSTGTISEFGMTWASSRINEENRKPIILYGAFWKEILDAIKKNMLIRPGELEILTICTTPEEVLKFIKDIENLYKVMDKDEAITVMDEATSNNPENNFGEKETLTSLV